MTPCCLKHSSTSSSKGAIFIYGGFYNAPSFLQITRTPIYIYIFIYPYTSHLSKFYNYTINIKCLNIYSAYYHNINQIIV